MRFCILGFLIISTYFSTTCGSIIGDNSNSSSNPSEPPNSERNMNQVYIKKGETLGETTDLCSICKRKSDCLTKKCYKGYCVNKRIEVRACMKNDLRTSKIQYLPPDQAIVDDSYPQPGPGPNSGTGPGPYYPSDSDRYPRPDDPYSPPRPYAPAVPNRRSPSGPTRKKGCVCSCGNGAGAFRKDGLNKLKAFGENLRNRRRRKRELRRNQFFKLHKNILASCNRCKSTLECPKRFEKCIRKRCAFDGSTRLACPIALARQSEKTGTLSSEPSKMECAKCELDSECENSKCTNGLCAIEGCTMPNDMSAPSSARQMEEDASDVSVNTENEEEDEEFEGMDDSDDDLDESEDYFGEEYGDFESQPGSRQILSNNDMDVPLDEGSEYFDEYLPDEEKENAESSMEPKDNADSEIEDDSMRKVGGPQTSDESSKKVD